MFWRWSYILPMWACLVLCLASVALCIVGLVLQGSDSDDSVTFLRDMMLAGNSGHSFAQIHWEYYGAALYFLGRIVNGDVEEAYDLTSTGFRKRQSLDKFRDMIERDRVLRRHYFVSLQDVYSGNNSKTNMIDIFVTNQEGATVSIRVRMVWEDNQWKVDRITIP